ncbi:hypothetical protein [Membranihabitans marinus]|uniref:hypothetical protein n=1 Tax=Membranihabitans marinus TaxID=1227546 RepID=UPI001F3AD30E|nr:hypothetical protein [Membranihabitans marinus]
MNSSDGRMISFAFSGGWLHHSTSGWVFDGAWINKVSPRSMTEWFTIKEAIGLIDKGYQPNGHITEIANHHSSSGIGLAHVGKKENHWNIDLWNIYLDKTINTSYFRLEYMKNKWQYGLIYTFQSPLLYQEGLNYDNRYIQPDEKGRVLSLMGQYCVHNTSIQIAYSRAFNSGRFLFPKELGRDQFYTSMSRSRLNGLGDIHVFKTGLEHGWKNLIVNLDAATLLGTDMKNLKYNKYKMADNTNYIL